MPRNNAAQLLASRWKLTPATSDLDSLFRSVIAAIDAPGVKHDQLVKAGKLSKSGISEAVREDAAKHYLPDLARARAAVERGRAELQAKRQSIVMPKIDRDDLLAAMQRREVRDRLLSMSLTERQALLSQAEPLFVAAINEVPLALSGVTPTMRDEMTRLYLHQHHQPELDAISEREEALDALNSAVQLALGELRQRAGLTPYARQFDGHPQDKNSKLLESFDGWFDREAGLTPKSTATNGSSAIDALYDRLKAEAVAEIASL